MEPQYVVLNMKGFYLPQSVRLVCVFTGIFAPCAAAQLNGIYQDRVESLPTIVDSHGNIASLETVEAGMQSYEHSKGFRAFSIAAPTTGIVLRGAAALSTGRRE